MLSFDKDQPSKAPFEFPRTTAETDVLETEVEKFLKKRVISPTKIQPDDYFSNVFTRQKKNGSYRTILNLEYLNEECCTQHFKMESIRYAIYMIRPGMFLASLDIKDAFYSIPVQKTHQMFLKFLLKGKALQFNAMPNGYIDAMRVFNKVLKPPFVYLREQGLSSVAYVDDRLWGGDTFQECQDNVFSTLTCLEDLGFYIHPEKSIFYSNTRYHISRIPH